MDFFGYYLFHMNRISSLHLGVFPKWPLCTFEMVMRAESAGQPASQCAADDDDAGVHSLIRAQPDDVAAAEQLLTCTNGLMLM